MYSYFGDTTLAAFLCASSAGLCGSLEAVEISEGDYEGRSQFVVRTEAATYYFDRKGGGFSRLIDAEGRDWIGFSKEPLSRFPDSAAAGYRGLPNAVFGSGNPDAGAGHPGFNRCESWLEDGRTIRSESQSGKWAWTWAFTEETATMTMEKADPDRTWWFLYEGPIAGRYAPARQYWGTDQGGPRFDAPDRQNQWFGQARWVYFGDRSLDRALFLAHHQPDNLADTVWYLGSSEGGAATAPDGMMVFGFGRGPGTKPLMGGAGDRFTIGLIETPGGRSLLRDENLEGARAGVAEFHRALGEKIEAALALPPDGTAQGGPKRRVD